MTSVFAFYEKYSRRRKRAAAKAHQRLDIQGLRMVAVLTVFANHLWGVPSGGFVGVDVFFVISGFLITSNLLRMGETSGNVSFRKFYWNRVRRIVPAATVVLILTWLSAELIFQSFRARDVGIDALYAFAFMANWHFAAQGTDYFQVSADTVSPIRHYWSLSIEEQFYFVWPLVVFIIGLIVVRMAWTHARRMVLAGAVMTLIIAASLGWALYQTSADPVWAYFDTFARVWELGVGALLATTVGLLARIPAAAKPFLSWTGLALIAASVVALSEGSTGFPAPWALLPVAGAALVIAAGVNGEPQFQAFLRNPVSGYIGDISYSLYLVHWPVIVILGSMMDGGVYFTVAALALSFGLAIASYHFVENPLRRANGDTARNAMRRIRSRQIEPERPTQLATAGAMLLLVVALLAYAIRPDAYEHSAPPPVTAAGVAEQIPPDAAQNMPLTLALQNEIVAALQAETWPALNPSMEQVINGSEHPVPGCGGFNLPDDPATCSWGSPNAPIRIVILGNSVAVYYAVALREMALNSNGQINVSMMGMFGCNFISDLIQNEDLRYQEECPARKQLAVDYINATKPNIVIISNSYNAKKVVGSETDMTPVEWSTSLRSFIDQFRGSTEKLVLLAPPAGDAKVAECYGTRGSVPADCIGDITDEWQSMAIAEQDVAASVGGSWIDSRPWFCSGGYCPSFVGTTPTKKDWIHILPEYGIRLQPVLMEAFKNAGILPR